MKYIYLILFLLLLMIIILLKNKKKGIFKNLSKKNIDKYYTNSWVINWDDNTINTLLERIPSGQDIIMLLGISGNPWLNNNGCNYVLSSSPNRFIQLKNIVTKLKTKSNLVLITIIDAFYMFTDFNIHNISPQPLNNDCEVSGITTTLLELQNCIDASLTDDEIRYCVKNNTSIIQHYIDLLIETGADGLDFDYELDMSNNISNAMITFFSQIKKEMLNRGKNIYISLSIVGSINKNIIDEYIPFADNIKNKHSNIDFLNIMSYNGQQTRFNKTLNGIGYSWNGVLNNSKINYLNEDSNTKLFLAVAGYDINKNKYGFTNDDTQKYIDLYYKNNIGKPNTWSNGLTFFGYEFSDVINLDLINSNINKSINCFKNNIC